MKKNDIKQIVLNDTTSQIEFIIPNVKEGSIIEYSYTKESYASNLNYHCFQHLIPTVKSCFQIAIPNRLDYEILQLGDFPINVNKVKSNQRIYLIYNGNYGRIDGINGNWNYDANLYTFIAKDLPPIELNSKPEDVSGLKFIFNGILIF